MRYLSRMSRKNIQSLTRIFHRSHIASVSEGQAKPSNRIATGEILSEDLYLRRTRELFFFRENASRDVRLPKCESSLVRANRSSRASILDCETLEIRDRSATKRNREKREESKKSSSSSILLRSNNNPELRKGL